MPEITLSHISKKFGPLTVIPEFNATIADGEFLVLLGPSGCGKSTLLRMIAGLASITSGEIKFDGVSVNDFSPSQRGVAFVFQSYALYPHMNVRQNIAFPLMMDGFRPWHHIPFVSGLRRWQMARRPDIVERVEKIAAQLELTHLMGRRPAKLSGGQRQRVALARALVRNPELYLLDEPLSNLDAKLRTQMRSEISALHSRVGKSFIYVTHDQVEAMTMASKIIVMNEGEIQQIGTPDEIYQMPANMFVARFVGAPPMNLLSVRAKDGTLTHQDNICWVHDGVIPERQELVLGLRPENLRLTEYSEKALAVEVAQIEKLGAEIIVGCRLQGATSAKPQEEEALLRQELIFVRISGSPKLKIGEAAYLTYAAGDVRWFDARTGAALPVAAQL